MALLTNAKAIREFYGETLGALASMRVLLVDRKINVIHDELERHMGDVDAMSAREWQRVRDRFPDLIRREKLLYRHRYVATRERDERAKLIVKARERAEIAAQRKANKSHRVCPTCGQPTFAAA